MKYRGILLVIVAVVITICSCNSITPRESIADTFSAAFLLTGSVEYEGFSGEVSFKKGGSESYELLYLAPASVAGQKITVNGETAVCEFAGISCERQTALLHEKSLICSLMHAANDAAREEGELKTSDGESVYTYESGARITVISGVPREIYLPALGCTLKVSGFES